MPNFYEILRVPEDASADEIANAAQNLINDWNPSFVKDSKNRDVMSDVQKDIIHMRDTLINPDKRREYNTSLQETRLKSTNDDSEDESVYEDALEYMTDDESDGLYNSFSQQYSDTFVATSVLDLQKNGKEKRQEGAASLKVELQPASEEDCEPKYYTANTRDATISSIKPDSTSSIPALETTRQDFDKSKSDSIRKEFDESQSTHKSFDSPTLESTRKDFDTHTPKSESVRKVISSATPSSGSTDFDSSITESTVKDFDSPASGSTRKDFDILPDTPESTSEKAFETKLTVTKQPNDVSANTFNPKQERIERKINGDEKLLEMQRPSQQPESLVWDSVDSKPKIEPLKAKTVCSYYDENNKVDLCVEVVKNPVKEEYDGRRDLLRSIKVPTTRLSVAATIDINGTKITTTHNCSHKDC